MKKRRTLIDGLSNHRIDTNVEREFVAGEQPSPHKGNQVPGATNQMSAPTDVGLVPISTRLQPDVAMALRRASLERKLNREFVNTVQEIVESALISWLREHGYLS